MTRRCLSAHTLPGHDRPAYISINTSADEQNVDITIRGPAMEEVGFGPQATINLTRQEFSLLILECLSRFING